MDVMTGKEILKRIKHFVVDWGTGPRQIVIFEFIRFLGAHGIKIDISGSSHLDDRVGTGPEAYLSNTCANSNPAYEMFGE